MKVSTSPRRGTNRLLRIAVGVVLLLTCMRVWIGPVPLAARAEAQTFNPALQRKQVLDEARRTNQLLSDIKRILESQTLNVRIEGADNLPGSPPVPRRKGP